MRYQFLRFPQGKTRAVTFSYDDGCQPDLRFAETLSQYGLKCTFNLNSDECVKTPLTKEQVESAFLAKGHEIAVHGYMHRAAGALRPIEGIQEYLNCRLELEQRYGRIIRGLAYPDTPKYLEGENTALCPHCGIDAIIPNNVDEPIDNELIEGMNKYWF